MKVLFATAELAPVARVGGLAEAASGLVAALRAERVDVEVVLPDYGDLTLTDQEELHVDVPDWVGDIRVRRGCHTIAGALTLVHVPGMDRPHPYVDADGDGWTDNDQRFMGFSAAIAGLRLLARPDVVHLNDWHTSAALGLLHDRPPTVLTIHTLGYQGVMDRHWLERLPVEAHRFAWYDSANPLAGAIELADRVVAVSPNYAAEIVTEPNGMGLHERLAALGDRLVGIRNGIDVSVWNPAFDPHLAASYSIDDLGGRQLCRSALSAEAGWPDDNVPLIGMVSRLVEQKGIDLVLDASRFLGTLPARLAVLGSGASELASGLARAANDAPDRVWFFDGYDETLAHRLFAGSDLFLMPSRFEPCGLAQMQAMAYGSIPVVTNVGGLLDTVADADDDRAGGTGFVAASVDSAGVVDSLHRAVRAARHTRRRAAIQRRGMTSDWSWAEPAAAYLELYRQLVGGHDATAAPLANTTTPLADTV
jgi:starch synthase